ncbi:MAG: cellulase family glycosylhydrolase, partial [Clostridia bacterium]|nr:cellulase family glycosylhydrolase [Clostridia bacterium]
MESISTCGKSFVDDKGRQRIFSGINYVYKEAQADGDGVIRYKNELTDGVLSALSKKGVNIIRLGFTWAGVEPEMEKYNAVYLDGIKEAVKRCEKYGIYVYLDLHQDLYSPFCHIGGDGAPAWACLYSKKPRRSRFIWAEGYFFDRNVMRCFDALWKNKEVCKRGLRDRYCDMLRFIAGYFADCENVMGYDVLNEPYPGTAGGRVFRNVAANGVLTLALSGNVNRKRAVKDLMNGDVMAALSVADDPVVYHGFIDGAEKMITKFDVGVYYDFIRACGEAIRGVTDKGVLFMENSYYSNLGIPCRTPAVVYENGEKEKNLAFAPHGYDITVDTPLTNKASPHRVDFIFDEHRRKQESMD